MRELDLAGLRLVHCGEDWPHDSPPCSREMVKFLERNETLVSWLEPCGGPNDVDRQVLAFLPPSVRGAFTLLFSHTLTPERAGAGAARAWKVLLDLAADDEVHLAQREAAQGLCQRGARAVWRRQAADPLQPVRREDAHRVQVQGAFVVYLVGSLLFRAFKFKVRSLSIWWAHFFFELSSLRCVRCLSGGLTSFSSFQV